MGRASTTQRTDIVLSDLQIPFNDKTATMLALDLIERLKPDCIHLLGDLCDCYSISDFDRDPTRKLDLGSELDKTQAFLADIRAVAPRRSEIRYSEGNHEDRLRRYIWKRCPELASLPSLDSRVLLDLDKYRVSFHHYTRPYQVGPLWFHHGKLVKKHSGATALAMIQQVGGHVICGHTHRMAHVYATTWSGTFQGWENGCLCRLDAEYLHGPPNWQQGLSVIRYGRGLRTFGVEQVRIHKRKYWVGGEEFSLTK